MAHPVVENLAARAKLQVLKGTGRNRCLPCAPRVLSHELSIVRSSRRSSWSPIRGDFLTTMKVLARRAIFVRKPSRKESLWRGWRHAIDPRRLYVRVDLSREFKLRWSSKWLKKKVIDGASMISKKKYFSNMTIFVPRTLFLYLILNSTTQEIAGIDCRGNSRDYCNATIRVNTSNFLR